MKHINTFGTWFRINEAEEMEAPMDAPMDAPEPGAAAASAASSKTEVLAQALREMPKKIEAALADTDSMTKTAVAEITRQGYTTKEGVIKQIVAGCTAELRKTITTSEWYEAARTGELAKSEAIAGKIQAALIKAVRDLIEKNKGAYASSVRGLPNFTDEKIKTAIAPMAVDAVREAFKAQLVKFADPIVVTGLNKFYRNFKIAYSKIEPGLEATVTQILTSVKPNAAGKAAGLVAGIFG
jgi:hypothetical protein